MELKVLLKDANFMNLTTKTEFTELYLQLHTGATTII